MLEEPGWSPHTFWLTTSIPGVSVRIPVGCILPPVIVVSTTATAVVSVIVVSVVWKHFRFRKMCNHLTFLDPQLMGCVSLVTCMLDPVGRFWGPCLYFLSCGTGNQGLECGHLASTLCLGLYPGLSQGLCPGLSQGLGPGLGHRGCPEDHDHHDHHEDHDHRVHHGCPGAHGYHAHKQVTVTEVGALCCPRNCCTGPWERTCPLVQRRLEFRLPMKWHKGL